MTLPVGGQIENLGYFQASQRWGIGISNPLGINSSIALFGLSYFLN